ncbi:DUF1501 domain-containing protein [Rhodopirellula baltica]|uniref:DUF1501 domain-containing protein n=1 Tax=Rhodopirellula baltica TaxID=265606 RepID=UPI0002DCEE11|nr:DUF1501 domain-containing protein [Rhodopirellula baltica]
MRFIPHQFNRRSVLQVGTLPALGLALNVAFGRSAKASEGGKAKSCVLIWLDGGPSHLETFDPKPDASAEVRGPFGAMPTSVPGIQLSELMPRTAGMMHHSAIVRSMTSPLGEHNFGTQYLMTGYKPSPALDYPAIGSVVSHLTPGQGAIPSHVAIPDHHVGGGRLVVPGFLPSSVAPFEVGGDPSKPDFRVRDLELYPGLTDERIERRRTYLNAMNHPHHFNADNIVEPFESSDPAFEQAYRLMTSRRGKDAFDLSSETQKTRDRYGSKPVGQACLLARRLVEAGVPFVTVNHRGWDTHNDLVTRLKDGFTGAKTPVGLIPSLDMAYSSLLADLHERNRLDETLVVVMGEFGRTPKINTLGGRDHWPRVFSIMLAGGGIAGGQVIGASDDMGESPKYRPVTPADLAATIYTLLGIDPQTDLKTSDGRPIKVNSNGTPIQELVG